MQINRTTLPNGLTLVHQEDTSTQMVAVNTLYKVGARNESPDHTGFAHLFEHLMFGGSIHVADFETPLQEASAENNAFTNTDYTNYYINIPAQNIETALWLESDRMLSLAFTPQSLEVQRKVVMEEFKQNYLNQPYGDVGHLLFATCYKVHPYRWPTIGLKLDHIAKARMSDVKRFFRRFYRPDNAILSIVGNISWERTQELVNKWYADIPHGTADMGKDRIPQEPPIRRMRSRTVTKKVPNAVLMLSFRIPKVTHPDFPVCDMITDVLAAGKSSRFYRKLVVEQKRFVSLDAYVVSRIDDGQLTIEAVLPEGADIDKCERAIWDELSILYDELVDEQEIKKLQNKFETNYQLQLVNYLERAQQLAYYEMLGDANLITKEVEKYAAVTPQRIKEVAKHYLRKSNCARLRYLKMK